MYCLTVLGVQHLKSRCGRGRAPSEGSGEGSAPGPVAVTPHMICLNTLVRMDQRQGGPVTPALVRSLAHECGPDLGLALKHRIWP